MQKNFTLSVLNIIQPFLYIRIYFLLKMIYINLPKNNKKVLYQYVGIKLFLLILVSFVI